MINKAKVITILFSAILVSFFIACSMNCDYPDLPLPIFQVLASVFLASFALPGILGISDSKIVKALFLIFFKDPVLLSFPIFQVFLSVVALMAEHSKVVYKDSALFTSWLFILVIVDLIYILWYLLYILHLFSSPKPMLEMFEKRIVKKIKRMRTLNYSSRKTLKEEILTLAKISRDTISDDKSYAIKTFSRLFNTFINPEINHNTDSNTPTDYQLELWQLMVESVSITCMGGNESYAGSEKNANDTIDIITKAWEATDKWAEKGADYAANTRELKKIGQFAIVKGYEDTLKRVLDVLYKIVAECIDDKPSPRISVAFIARDIEILGVDYIKAGREFYALNFISSLMRIYLAAERKLSFLFQLLNLMSLLWKTNNDALTALSRYLGRIDKSKIKEVVKYGENFSSIETIRIKRFLKAVNKFQ